VHEGNLHPPLVGKPLPRFGRFSMFEVEDFRRGEWPAKQSHRFFPFCVVNNCQPFDVIEVFRI
jgi:hypothetical protein